MARATIAMRKLRAAVLALGSEATTGAVFGFAALDILDLSRRRLPAGRSGAVAKLQRQSLPENRNPCYDPLVMSDWVQTATISRTEQSRHVAALPVAFCGGLLADKDFLPQGVSATD